MAVESIEYFEWRRRELIMDARLLRSRFTTVHTCALKYSWLRLASLLSFSKSNRQGTQLNGDELNGQGTDYSAIFMLTLLCKVTAWAPFDSFPPS